MKKLLALALALVMVFALAACGSDTTEPSADPAASGSPAADPGTTESNEPTAEPRTRFSIKFYYVAILFVIIDVEAIFLYTWAVEFVRLGSLGLAEMLTFMTLLVLAYAYAWKKGAFEWVK